MVELDLAGVDISDTGAEFLGAQRQLKELNISGTHITDIGLTNLERLSNLESLYLGGAPISDAGMKTLAKRASPALGNQWYRRDGRRAGEIDGPLQPRMAGAWRDSDFGRRPRICQKKSEKSNRFGPRSRRASPTRELAALDGLSRLNSLSLTRTAVTDDGILHLARLPKLRVLHLNGTSGTNATTSHESERVRVPGKTLAS